MTRPRNWTALALLVVGGCSKGPDAESRNAPVATPAPPPPARTAPQTVAVAPAPPAATPVPSAAPQASPTSPSAPSPKFAAASPAAEPQAKSFVVIGGNRRGLKGIPTGPEEDLRVLNDALKAYLGIGKPVPGRLDELVSAGLLLKLPKPPSGQRFEIDPASREVRLVAAVGKP